VISALALGLFSLLQAEVASPATAVERGEMGSPALVIVALPPNANRPILEALNRLRGEATSVGFDVRFVEATAESMTLAQLDRLAHGLQSAAVVAFAGPDDSAPSAHSFDVWFLDRASGKTSVAHLSADDVANAADRTEVVLAVRAVDFIRARMFDTLAGRRPEPVRLEPRPDGARIRRRYLGAGLRVLAGPPGFSVALAPHIEVGYGFAEWGRLGAMALGLGSQPVNDGSSGRVSLDPRLVGASLTILGRAWHRLQPALAVGAGEFWVVVQGQAQSPNVGQTATLSSLYADLAVGMSVTILPYLMLDLRAGSLWLRSEARIYSTSDTYLGSVGRPTWFGSAQLVTSF
jgi:hypothetical protein